MRPLSPNSLPSTTCVVKWTKSTTSVTCLLLLTLITYVFDLLEISVRFFDVAMSPPHQEMGLFFSLIIIPLQHSFNEEGLTRRDFSSFLLTLFLSTGQIHVDGFLGRGGGYYRARKRRRCAFDGYSSRRARSLHHDQIDRHLFVLQSFRRRFGAHPEGRPERWQRLLDQLD